jgi:hypothetical protein
LPGYDAGVLHLKQWESFYVIVGSSAGALTGLMFVVAALTSSEMRTTAQTSAVRVFATPTIVHFGAVLLLAGIVSMPGQTRTSMSVCLVAIGLTLFGYIVRIATHARRQQAYAPLRSDWLFYMVLPAAAYASVVVAGILLAARTGRPMYVVAIAAMLLLFIGIRNAWDGAVWIIFTQAERAEQEAGEPPANVEP